MACASTATNQVCEAPAALHLQSGAAVGRLIRHRGQLQAGTTFATGNVTNLANTCKLHCNGELMHKVGVLRHDSLGGRVSSAARIVINPPVAS